MNTVELIHEDAHFLVFNKPSGLLSVPGRGEDKQDCLSSRAQQIYSDALVVHRLDMSTSGLIVMARGTQSQRSLNKAFTERRVSKRYVAWVEGLVIADRESWQTIDLPISADWPERPLQKIDLKAGKSSQTRWQLLRHDPLRQISLLELEPITGRTHQLRLHLQAIKHPIVGDKLYGTNNSSNNPQRLCLHAHALTIPHPDSGQECHFECEPDFSF